VGQAVGAAADCSRMVCTVIEIIWLIELGPMAKSLWLLVHMMCTLLMSLSTKSCRRVSLSVMCFE